LSVQETSTPLPLDSLRPGQKLTGKVVKIELFGAFVNVGAELPGLLHISRLRKGHVNRVEDVLQQGQDLEAWVHKVDPVTRRLELTLIRPIEVKWGQIKPGNRYDGKVVRLEKFGAFVDFGAERPGLVHVSEMRDDYVPDPQAIVSVGDQVSVTVLEVDRKKKQIRLTMKEEQQEYMAEEVEEKIPTAMEVALRQALEQTDGQPAREAHTQARDGKPSRDELENILSRTLASKVKTSSKE